MYRRDLRDTDVDRLLADASMVDSVQGLAPEPDGDRIAYAVTREDRTDLWLTDGDSRTRLTGGGALAMAGGRVDQRWFDWHPDGDRIVYTTVGDDGGALLTVDTETGDRERLLGGELATNPAFSPDGDEIAFVTNEPPGGLAVVSADGRRRELLADDEYYYVDPRWADDGRLYAARSRHRDLQDRGCEIVRADGDGEPEVVLSDGDVQMYAPRPRPGGDELAFVHDRTGYDALSLTDGDGDPELLFGREGAEIASPVWNADGDRLAVVVTEDGDQQIHVVELDGTTERLSDEPGTRFAPAWHDGSVIAGVGTPSRPPSVRNVSTGETVAVDPPVGPAERFVEPEELTYESTGGLEIHAMVYLPPEAEDADDGEIPLIVHPHGGPTAYDGYEFNPRAQYFVAQGYAVIEPNYRGSAGFGREFRDRNDHAWGDGDLDDVVNAADALADAYSEVDGDRAGIFGGSGGGLMTANALGNSDRFDAGAAFYGVYDYESFVNDTDDVGWRLMKRELGYPATDIENYRDASPIEAVEEIDAPLLVLHGEEDARVPISQSEQLVAELEKHGKRHEFRRYDGEPHGFQRRENVLDAYSRVADLFAKYLQIDPDDGSSDPWTPPEGDA